MPRQTQVPDRATLAHEFNALPEIALVNERLTSAVTGIPVRSLQQNRCNKVGIPFIRNGRSVLYRKADIVAFIEGRLETIKGMTGAQQRAAA